MKLRIAVVAVAVIVLALLVNVVWGERDVLTPTATNVERYQSAGLTPTVIAGSGHSLPDGRDPRRVRRGRLRLHRAVTASACTWMRFADTGEHPST